MKAYQNKAVLLGAAASIVVAAAQTNYPISERFMASWQDARNGFLDAKVSAITVVGSITLKVQDSSDGTNWNDVKTLALTTTGLKSIRWHIQDATDQAYLPLRAHVRAVVTNTNAGDTVTFTDVRFSAAG